MNMVRITVTDGMGRKQVHEDTFSPADMTPGIAIKELIDSAVILRDSDTIECSVIEDYDPTPWCSSCGARRQADCDCGPIADNE